MHPLMAAMGISFCFFLTMALLESVVRPTRRDAERSGRACAAGMGLRAGQSGLEQGFGHATYYYIYKWTWYEWLGALAPLVFFWVLWRIARKRGETLLARFAAAVFAYGVFQQVLAMAMLCPSSLVRLTPLQPMRYLHLLYFLFMMTAGACWGNLSEAKRVALGGVPACLQRLHVCLAAGGFGGSEHLELPGRAPANPWLQAFAWIRRIRRRTRTSRWIRTMGAGRRLSRVSRAGRAQPTGRCGEGRGGGDAGAGAGAGVGEPGAAQQGWRNFKLADFERLKDEFGVDWVLVSYSSARRPRLPVAQSYAGRVPDSVTSRNPHAR